MSTIVWTIFENLDEKKQRGCGRITSNIVRIGRINNSQQK